jgi:hypothetical protein
MGESKGTHTNRTRMWRFRGIVGRYINPITRPVASKLPAFGILTHRGASLGAPTEPRSTCSDEATITSSS